MKLIVNSQKSLVKCFNQLSELFEERKYLEITIVEQGKSRTLKLNSVSHRWYDQVSKEEHEYTAGQVKRLCKYYYGLPILRGSDEEYNEKCVKFIDSLPFEDRIEVMELWPATSLMTNKQMLRYLEQVQAHYAGRVNLQFKEEDE
jgi:hypothetical protein